MDNPDPPLNSSSILANVALNQANIGIAIYDETGCYRYVNDYFGFLLRSSSDDVIGRSVWDVRQSLSEAKYPDYWNSYKPGDCYVCEDQLNLKLGSPLPVRIHGSRIEIGDTPYQLESVEDIREEKARREKLTTFREALEQTGHTVIITDPDGTIQYTNPAFERVTGYSSDEVRGENPRILKSGQHEDQFYEEIWQTILAGRVWTGKVINRRKNGELYRVRQSISPIKNDDGDIVKFVAVNKDITNNQELISQLEYKAQHDHLTGLLNRDKFKQILRDAVQTKTHNSQYQFAIMFLDLDGFKQINDTYGHTIGDQVLKTIASRFKNVMRPSDTVARYGGDEFIFHVDHFSELSNLKSIGARLIHSLDEAINAEDHTINLTASLGIVVPEENLGADELIRKADNVMYVAKSKGGNDFSLEHVE